MAQTDIEWTRTVLDDGTVLPGYTFNLVWGCTKVSPACDNCYAEAFSKRTGHDVWGPLGARRFMSPRYYRAPLKWNAEAERMGVRRKVFCSSMADVAENHPALDAARPWLWELIDRTPWLDWLLLTKRPGRLPRVLPAAWVRDGCPDNVWLGTTVEHQRFLDRRARELLSVSAPVHFLSCEPLLGELDLHPYIGNFCGCGLPQEPCDDWRAGRCKLAPAKLSWVIVGGESGPRAREFDLAHARSIVAQCRLAGVPCFMKQTGSVVRYHSDEDIEHFGLARFSGDDDLLKPKHWKGGDPNEWPEALRVREQPGESLTC